MKEDYKYKISVIVPVYNVEKYLEETIESVIAQTLGFKNIQLILVNDGSPDNSEKICLKYKEKYPDNVVYIKQKNSGVSSARNNGINAATGKYIQFLDSDDKVSKNAYKRAIDLLEKNPDVGFAFLRIKFFDAAKGFHGLDYKFKNGTRIIDLEKEPNIITYHSPTIITRSELIKSQQFDIRVAISEDVKYIADLEFKNSKVAAIADEYYFYRKRQEETSAIQTSRKKKTFYVDTPKLVFEYILGLCNKNKKLSRHYQNSVSYDLWWRLFDVNLDVLSDKEQSEYIEKIRSLYKKIDDDIIISRYYSNELALSKNMRAIEFKYKTPVYKDINFKENGLYLYGKKILDYSNLSLEIYNLNIHKNNLIINSSFKLFLNCDWEVFIKADDKYIKMNRKEMSDSKNLFSFDNTYKIPFYDYELNLDNVKNIEFFLKVRNKYYKLNLNFTKFARLNSLKNSYFKKNNYVVSYENNTIKINDKKAFRFIRYMSELLFKKKEILPFGMITLHFLTYPFAKHKNWIVSDRYDVAGDNGEWMFKYIKKNCDKNNVYFALKKNSNDIEKISKVGKVIHFKTLNYYLKYMNSEFVISSHIDSYIHKPFGTKEKYINPFIDRKFVFLQHGIIKENLSSWLSQYYKDISLFICSAKAEYDSVVNGDYLFDENTVKLTGLARYDNLVSNKTKPENIIALMPTWRSTLVGGIINGTQDRKYNSKFKETEYYKFYNGLINDERIIKCLKENNYKILFCIHPSFKGQLKDFTINNDCVEKTVYVDYPEVFKKSKLLITDYSSVYFDFAYLKKPVIYSLFDIKYVHLIHSIHTGKDDYFDYDTMGFGPATYDYEQTVDVLIKYVKNGCKMEKKYIDRVDNFFEYFDDNNCKRIYDEIIKKQE